MLCHIFLLSDMPQSKAPINATVDLDVVAAIERISARWGVPKSQAVNRLLREGLKGAGEDALGKDESIDPTITRSLALKELEKFIERVGKEDIRRWMQVYEQLNGPPVVPGNFSRVDGVVARMFAGAEGLGLTTSEVVDFREWMEIAKRIAEAEEQIKRQHTAILAKPAGFPPPSNGGGEAQPQRGPEGAGGAERREVRTLKKVKDNYYWYVKYRKGGGGWDWKCVGRATPEEVKERLERRTRQAPPQPLALVGNETPSEVSPA